MGRSITRVGLALFLLGSSVGVAAGCAQAPASRADERPAEQSAEPAASAPEAQPTAGSPAEPTDEQQQLNNDAVEAMIEEKYARAAALLEQSLLIGELNVTYLNLGRAYQKLGKCDRARSALVEVAGAPQVAKPEHALVLERAEAYLAQLSEACGDAPEQDQEDVEREDEKDPRNPRNPRNPNKRDRPDVPVSF